MKDIISWYNRNRKRIWIRILLVVGIGYLLYRFLGFINNDGTRTIIDDTPVIDTKELNSVIIQDQKSLITGNRINVTQKEFNVIDEFVTYCNSGQIQEAYNLLSDECKEEMYKSVEDFKNAYYLAYFNGETRNVKVENWIGKIYRLNIREDALATGKYEPSETLLDYVVITKDSKETPKLNINGYIERKKYEAQGEKGNIQIKVVQSDLYMDYEYYTIEVTNNEKNTIALADVEDLEAIYLIDKNELKYKAQLNEIMQQDIEVKPNETKTIRMKFLNRYSSTREIKGMVFDRILLNYANYTTKRFYEKTDVVRIEL